MIESIIVAAIVIAAAVFLFQNWRKSNAGKKVGCQGKSCGCDKPKKN
ncbi:FeoB-associated Cys-rich membrane protein [Cerasicoccus fimbriatus]|nr:FeoB-associated Cys-rich membrane protein [Cerasicoccus sp. TK19100]